MKIKLTPAIVNAARDAFWTAMQNDKMTNDALVDAVEAAVAKINEGVDRSAARAAATADLAAANATLQADIPANTTPEYAHAKAGVL
jgi:hypothetical protein